MHNAFSRVLFYGLFCFLSAGATATGVLEQYLPEFGTIHLRIRPLPRRRHAGGRHRQEGVNGGTVLRRRGARWHCPAHCPEEEGCMVPFS